jgi:predicted transcriptional regulator
MAESTAAASTPADQGVAANRIAATPQPSSTAAPPAPRVPADGAEQQPIDDRALQALQGAYAAFALERPLPDPAQQAQHLAERGADATTAGALAALATAAVRRAQFPDDTIARGLRQIGTSRIATHLSAIAKLLADPSEGVQVAPFEDAARDLFQQITDNDVRYLLGIAAESPPEPSPDAPTPVFNGADLEGPRQLLSAVARNLDELAGGPTPVTGERDALVIIRSVLVVGLAHERADRAAETYPPRIHAMDVVGTSRNPQETVAMIQDFADWLDETSTDEQRPAMRYNEQHTLSDYLRAVSRNAADTLANPELVALIRTARIFGSNGEALYRRTVAPEPSNSVQNSTTTPAAPAASEAQVAVEPAPSAVVHNSLPEEPSPILDAVARSVRSSTPTGTEPVDPATARRDAEVTIYDRNPDLMPEHALLGSALHAPQILDDVQMFLRPRNFSLPETRATYETLVGLRAEHLLLDVRGVAEPQRMRAAFENRINLRRALLDAPNKYTQITLDRAAVDRVLLNIDDAAPLDTLGTRSVYNPAAQLQLGRLVLEKATDRTLRASGLAIEQSQPLTPVRFSARVGRDAKAMIAALERVDKNLDSISHQWQEASLVLGPDRRADGLADQEVAASSAKRWKVPDRLLRITNPQRHRAERDLLHLMMHCGDLSDVPQAVLDLSPDVFSDSRHATTWRVIQSLHERGERITYPMVADQLHGKAFAENPGLPDGALIRMSRRPDLPVSKIGRALRAVTQSALARAKADFQYGLAALSTDRLAPGQQAVATARQLVSGVRDRAEVVARNAPARHAAGKGSSR